jgi:hypothetical protein
MHLLAERFAFWGVMIGVFVRERQDLPNGINVASEIV